MKNRNRFAFALVLLSFVVLVPGLTQPLITITASMDFMGVSKELFRETRSILQTVRNLHQSGDDFVAGLILLFSVVVPVTKGVLLVVALASRQSATRTRLVAFVNAISKWSMAHVFLVGVYVAYLAAKATDALDATAEPGFYWFAVYCLLSVASAQFMSLNDTRDRAEPPATTGG